MSDEQQKRPRTRKCHSGIVDQAVIVVSLQADGTLLISSRNNGRSKCAKVADAIVKMSGAAIENRLGWKRGRRERAT